MDKPAFDNHATPIEHVTIGGLPAARISLAQLIERLLNDSRRTLMEGAPARLVFDINGHGISLAARDRDYRDAMDQADIVHADGGVVVAASRLFASPGIPDRSATTDLYLDSLQSAAKAGTRYFLLGGEERVNAACAIRSTELAPGLQIVGRHHGYFTADEEEAIIDQINAVAPDVLWIGLGKPREQLLSVRWRKRVRAGWIVTCGGLYNYVTGDYPRAPLWMRKSGLEWLHRTITDPRKFFWRYLTTNPHALWLIATQSQRAARRKDCA